MSSHQKVLDLGFTPQESIINRNISYMQMMDDPVELGRCQQLVYECIKSHSTMGGITDQDIAEIIDMPLASVNARRNELIHKGLVHSNGSIEYDDTTGKTHYRTLWII